MPDATAECDMYDTSSHSSHQLLLLRPFGAGCKVKVLAVFGTLAILPSEPVASLELATSLGPATDPEYADDMLLPVLGSVLSAPLALVEPEVLEGGAFLAPGASRVGSRSDGLGGSQSLPWLLGVFGVGIPTARPHLCLEFWSPMSQAVVAWTCNLTSRPPYSDSADHRHRI